MLERNPIKRTMIHEIAEQVMEYTKKREDVPYIDDIHRYNFYEGQIEALYDLAMRFDIWNYEINDRIREIVRGMSEEEIEEKGLGFFVDKVGDD